MSLAHVILGLLQQQQRTGYDLKTDCFDQGIAHLWQADQAQIYRTLERLETQGWIICTVEIQRDRPNRKVYNITEAGTAALTQWLQTHQLLPVIREPLLMQLYFAASLPNPSIIQLLEQERVAHQEKLAQCIVIHTSLCGDSEVSRDQHLHQLALDLITRREQTYLDWLDDTINILRHQ